MNLYSLTVTLLRQAIPNQYLLDQYLLRLNLSLVDLAAQNTLPQMILDVVRNWWRADGSSNSSTSSQ